MTSPKDQTVTDPRDVLGLLIDRGQHKKVAIAKAAGVSPNLIYRFLRGEDVNYENVQKMLGVFGYGLHAGRSG